MLALPAHPMQKWNHFYTRVSTHEGALAKVEKRIDIVR